MESIVYKTIITQDKINKIIITRDNIKIGYINQITIIESGNIAVPRFIEISGECVKVVFHNKLMDNIFKDGEQLFPFNIEHNNFIIENVWCSKTLPIYGITEDFTHVDFFDWKAESIKQINKIDLV